MVRGGHRDVDGDWFGSAQGVLFEQVGLDAHLGGCGEQGVDQVVDGPWFGRVADGFDPANVGCDASGYGVVVFDPEPVGGAVVDGGPCGLDAPGDLGLHIRVE